MAEVNLHTRNKSVAAIIDGRNGFEWLRLLVGADEVMLFSGTLSPDQLRRIADIVNERAPQHWDKHDPDSLGEAA